MLSKLRSHATSQLEILVVQGSGWSWFLGRKRGVSKRKCWEGGIKNIEETVVVKEDGGGLDVRGTFLRFGTVERRGEGRR